MAPSAIWAATPTTSPKDHLVRLAEVGTRRREPRTARTTAIETRPVTKRFPNSTHA